MKFKIKVCKASDPSHPWEETYMEQVSDPKKWGQELVDKFNAEIPEKGGDPRLFLGAEIISESGEKLKTSTGKVHKWEKTNLLTIQRGSKIYDTYKCVRCGVTAKVYGLDIDHKIRDTKFKAKKYEYCNID